MPSAQEIARAITGAWRLFCFDPKGLELFEDSPEAFWKSFTAALIVAPGFAALVALRVRDLEVQDSLLAIFALESMSYVVLWTAMPVLLYSICRLIDRERRYLIVVIALNWSVVIQLAITLPLHLVVAEGLLQSGLASLALLVIVVVPIVYVWFVAKTALEVSGLAAAAVVLADQIVSILVRSTTNALY